MRRVVARVVQALLGASAVAWLAYLGLPDGDGATEIEVSLAILAIAWLGVETVGRAATSAWRTYRFDHDANLRQGAENRLAEAFIEIIEIDVGTEGEVQHIHPAHFGLNAFAVRWTHRGRRELVRVARQRLRRYHPPPSPRIRWTKGKGLIGRCWATADLEIVETASAWQPYLACTRKRWRELDDDVTLDLKYGDFKALRTKYKGGMALPILGENRTVMGVVAIDLAPESPLQVKCLHRDAVARTLERAARGVGDLMRMKG